MDEAVGVAPVGGIGPGVLWIFEEKARGRIEFDKIDSAGVGPKDHP